MLEFVASYNLGTLDWVLIIIAVACIGANKTGIVGVNLIAVPILASIFGGKASTGILMPFLMMADILAVSSYRKNIQWKDLFRILFFALFGIGIALGVGQMISDKVFKVIIASIIICLLILTVINEIRKKDLIKREHVWATLLLGVVIGFVAMIGNAAGPILSVYLIALHLTKNEYIATRAWFFWIINIIKIPLHIFIWKTITTGSFLFNLALSPAIVLGAIIGFWIVRRISEKQYKLFIIAVTFVSAVIMLI